MHIIPILALGEMPWFTIIGGAVAIVIVFFIFLGIWASRYTKVGPDAEENEEYDDDQQPRLMVNHGISRGASMVIIHRDYLNSLFEFLFTLRVRHKTACPRYASS